MTAQILAGELVTLVNESKRKNADLRNGADKSLQELRSLPFTSDAQLSADLARRIAFIDPLVRACQTRNAKLASPAVVCLQRLVALHAVPQSRLNEVLDGFRDSSNLGLDIQLKILQTLPSLLQNYPDQIHGELLSTVLQVCSTLQTTKNPIASATAAATLQQLVMAVFEKVVVEDGRQLQIPTVTEVSGDNGDISVRPAANDAYKIFRDICLLTEGSRPQSIRFSAISQDVGLELVEAVMSNHSGLFVSHAEQALILRSHIMPLIIKGLSERLSFSVTLRIARIFNLVLRHHLAIVASECEIALSLLNHMLDPDAGAPWKRSMCMEIFRNVYSDPNLILQIYDQYDYQDGRKPIIRDSLAMFARVSKEKPAVIGHGQPSTVPISPPEEDVLPDAQAALEAGAVGIIGGAPSTSTVPGISTRWSTVKVPCMDHLDKQDPPVLPETYIYTLVLSCINNYSESLAKLILPLTVHKESRKKKAKGDETAHTQPADDRVEDKPKSRVARSQSFRRRTVPINPLELTNSSARDTAIMTAEAITGCWPAVLATCSTFLNAALDNEHYHDLVRSMQKFTQIAGLLRLSTPRDAFLTTLGKAAVPPTIFSATVSSPRSPGTETPTLYGNKSGMWSVESLVSHGSDKARRVSMDSGTPSLSTRNLLCLRALLNLAIALGPTLDSAWSIVFETLQQADVIMAAASSTNRGRDRRGHAHSGVAVAQAMGPEFAAVEAVSSRLFESTVDFPNESFVQVLQSLCALLDSKPNRPMASLGIALPILQEGKQTNYDTDSNTESHVQDYAFSLRKLGELGTLNANRLISFKPNVSGWSLLIGTLVSVARSPTLAGPVRLLAADVLGSLVQEAIKETQAEEQPLKNEIHVRALSALQLVVNSLNDDFHATKNESNETEVEIHTAILDALKSVLEQCGDSLQVGWNIVFLLTRTVFLDASTTTQNENPDRLPVKVDGGSQSPEMITRNMGRLAFSLVQLVCSDFLTSTPDDVTFLLLDLLYMFCSQNEDLNISLTTITFFWRVSDHLHGRAGAMAMEELAVKSIDVANPEELIGESVLSHSIPAMWLHLLERLATLAHDGRAEVRHGALHTLFRIFDSYGDQLSEISWNLCLRVIVFRLLSFDVMQHQTFRSAEVGAEETRAWAETSKIILDGLVKLFTSYRTKILHAPRFPVLWNIMLDYLRQYLGCGSQAVNAATYDALSGLVSQFATADVAGEGSIQRALRIWLDDPPSSRDDYPSKDSNHDAYLAYVRCFRSLYRLVGNDMETETLSKVASNLQTCVTTEDSPGYASGRDILTPLQKEVLEVIVLIKANFKGTLTILVKLLAGLVTLPFRRPVLNGAHDGNTFVAISKDSMEVIQRLVTDHAGSSELYTSGAIQAVLQSLVMPICLKYGWKAKDKAPSAWRKATTTALNILGPILANAQSLSIEHHHMVPIWQETVSIASGIAGADAAAAPSPSVVLEDEHFDMQSLSSLRDTITPGLGASYIPDATRLAYASMLFHTSLMHAPFADEIASDPCSASSLYRIRRGRTRDPPATVRERMSYLCLRELLSLVQRPACSDAGQQHRVALARAAAPFLLQRAALPIKAYIADQPLRGRLPQPQSQHKELLFILHELRTLECETSAVPFESGIDECVDGKWHLRILYPLVVQAMGVAAVVPGGDGEVVKASGLLLTERTCRSHFG